MQLLDPNRISKLSKEELVEWFANSNHALEDIQAQIKAIKDELVSRMKSSGEIVGNYSLTKAKRINFKVDIEKARELGAVKEAVDTRTLKKLYDNGVELEHSVTEYLLVRPVERKEKVIKNG